MTDDLKLIRRYEPVLVFSRDGNRRPEDFFPMAVEHYVARCGLYHKTQGEVCPPGQVTLPTLAQLGDDTAEHYLAYATRQVLSQVPQQAVAAGLTLSRVPNLQYQIALSAGLPAGEANRLQRDVPNVLLVERPEPDRREGMTRIEDAEGLTLPRGLPADLALIPPGEEGPGEMVDVVLLGEGRATAEPSEARVQPADMGLDVRPAAAGDRVLAPGLQPAAVGRLPQHILDQARQNYAPQRDLEAFPPVYYYRAMHDSGYVVLQYWFFYAYNDWGTAHGGWDDHEGDWEGVVVFLRDEDTPVHVAYSKHFRVQFILEPDVYGWSDDRLNKRRLHHPVVHVASGSHASYVERRLHGVPSDFVSVFKDYALGNQLKIGPGQRIRWGEPVELEQQEWAMKFRGRWGALWRRPLGPVLGIDGPTGPSCKGRWNEPVRWAGL